MSRRVVITGLGAVSPCGLGVDTAWTAVCAGQSCLSEIRSFNPGDYPTRIAGEVAGFDAEALLGKKQARRIGRFMQFALVAGDEAMSDAGYDRAQGEWPVPERFGVYIGSGIGGFPEIVNGAYDLQREGHRGISPFFIPRSLINLATGSAAIRYGAQGPSLVVATACAVGNHAIGEAFKAVRYGDADVILAGGAEASIHPLSLTGFGNMKALSRRNDSPGTASRPFDAERDGFVMSEGAGVVVLETLDGALARGARIYAEVVGYGATTDAHHITAPAPGGDGAVRCMRRALEVADLRPEDVDYINAHGTSTPTNDRTETQAIRTCFGPHADRLAVSSTKGVTGHLLGAAGGLEGVFVARALHEQVIPPTANLTTPDPDCDLDCVPLTARPSDIRVALSNGFGFGGTNAVLAFKRWECT